ncbi:MAG: nuclease [Bacteroidetes bacterium]|nr:nuclease [Bacteroidota bacterium]
MYNSRRYFLLTIILCSVIISQGAIPAGYYHFVRGKKKAELKTTLHEISSPLAVLDYGSGPGFTWQGFYSTDRNADGTVRDMYSNTVRSFSGYNSVEGMAIEHSFPKSWWGAYENTAYKDLFHLYPADATTNGIKNNLPLGEVTGTPVLDNGKSKIGPNGFGTVYSDNCFEPADEYKGDFARSYLYISTIYEDLAPLWNSPMLTNTIYPAWKSWAVDLLLKWSANDPVSQKEINRNDSIYAIQGNRNPFIDFPQLPSYIWGKDTLSEFTFPEETGAFLVTPRRKFKLDFGVVLLNVTKTQKFTVQGMNITSPLTVSFLRNSSSLSLSTTTISVADAQAGFNLQVNYLPTTTGTTVDTLLIQGGGLTEITRIPVRGVATSEFMTTEPTEITPAGGILHWLEDPYATNYTVSLYKGDTKAGDLIISGYVEGASNDKALELFNGTGADVDLSKYTLRKQTNGQGGFVVTQKLAGILPNNQTYVIVYNPPSSSNPVSNDLKSKANMFADSICAFNGNDAVALFRNGLQIDAVGKINGGADYSWGTDKILKRKANITHPANNFDLSQWIEYAYDRFDKIGTHSMNFAAESNYIFKNKSVGIVNELLVDNLVPEENYTYDVTSYRSGVVAKTVNTQRLKTAGLEIPVEMAATDIGTASFTANWEEVPYASGYYLDVYQLSGQLTTETEGFNNVGTNGKPLPTGWNGSVNGNYTTVASSGQSPNSLGFKNNGDTLITKQFPDIISKLTFMYRYPSSGTGSYLKIEVQNTSGWKKIDSLVYVNTSKYYPTYTFPVEKAYTSVKFTYNKVTGNLALDDVAITHGQVDTLYVHKNQFVTGNQYQVSGLHAGNPYYYRIRAGRENSYSTYSGTINVNTVSTATDKIINSIYRIGTLPYAIRIFNLKGNETLRLFSITGSVIVQEHALSTTISLPVRSRGIFILQISDGIKTETYKIVR